MDSVRIDKYLWAIRVFKTRSDAAEACNGNKVRINGATAKAAKAVKPGDTVEVRKGSALLSYRIIKLSESRMGAALRCSSPLPPPPPPPPHRDTPLPRTGCGVRKRTLHRAQRHRRPPAGGGAFFAHR